MMERVTLWRWRAGENPWQSKDQPVQLEEGVEYEVRTFIDPSEVAAACERSIAIAGKSKYDQGHRDEAEHILALLRDRAGEES